MTYAIRGTIFDTSSPFEPLAYVGVRIALDVGLEDGSTAPSARPTEVSLWEAQTDGLGLFSCPFTHEQVEKLLAGRRHRELLFKIYDSSGILLGAQLAFVSWATFVGTDTLTLGASSSYSLATGVPNFAVCGFVTEADGAPCSGAIIIVSKKLLRSQTALATYTTGPDGRFLIRYAGSPGEHSDHANFSLLIEAPNISMAREICNPPADYTVRLVRGDERYRGRSDFELDVDVLNPLLDSATLDELDVEDVEFLLCRTRHDAATVATIVRSHALSDAFGVPPEAFSAFSYAGIPLSTNVVTGLDAATITDAIAQAIEANAVRPSLVNDLPTIISALAAARVDRIVPTSDPETTTLGSILVAASLTPNLPREFAVAFVQHTGTASEFWDTLRGNTNFGPQVVDRIQFTLQVGAITASHPPLVKFLHELRDSQNIRSAAELTKLSASEWRDHLDRIVDGAPVGHPLGVVGTDDTDRRASYALAISKMVEDLYPSAHLAHRVPNNIVAPGFAEFILQNPGFSFQRTHIADFFPTANGRPAATTAQEVLKQDLLKVQRISAIAPRFSRTETATTLLAANVTSAGQIQRMGFAAFKAKFGSALDESTLNATYEKADQVASVALNAFMFTRPEMHFPQTRSMPVPASSELELEDIFGKLDYCSCRHCSSVYGPAAYFVDIMQYLRVRKAGTNTLLSVLTARRPELTHILLNCDNANTPLPTIDLINETLERRCRPYLGLAPIVYDEESDWPQTTWSADELVARPEHVDHAVYTQLAKHTVAYFPHSLPFDLPFEEARAYLQVLGSPKYALQDALAWFDGFDEDLAFRVDERLGLSPGQSAIVRGLPGTKALPLLWGFDDADDWLLKINGVELFLERAGLDISGLKALLKARILGDVEIDYEEPCALKNAKLVNGNAPNLVGLNTDRLKLVKIFLRLQRSLGWSTPELDATFQGLGAWMSDPEADLVKVARFVQLRRRFPQLSTFEVLSWFALLDRHVYEDGSPTYYDTVVQPRARDAAFMTLSGPETLGDLRGDILGILRTDDAGLAAAYEATGLSDDSLLAQSNLSKLYRVASIARTVDLSIPELVTLTRFTATLNSVTAGPFAGGAGAPVRELIDLAENVRRSGFSVGALDWILRGQQAEQFGASDLDVTRVLIGLIVALQEALADHLQSLPQDLETSVRVEKLLAGPLPAVKVEEAMRFIRKQTNPAPLNDAAAAALANDLLFFLTPGSPAYVEFGKAFANAGTESSRLDLLETPLITWLRSQRLERLVVQQMATALALEPADTEVLLRLFTQENTTAMAWLTADAFFAKSSFDSNADGASSKEPWFPAKFLERLDVAKRAVLYRGLRKSALVASTFGFAPGLLRWLLTHVADAQVKLLDLANLPVYSEPNDALLVYDAYAGWDWLRRAMYVRDEVLKDPSALTVLLDLFFASPGFNKSTSLKALAAAAGWDPAALLSFEASEAITQVDLKSLEAVEAFAAAFRLSDRLGVRPTTVRSWAKDAIVSATDAAAIRGAAEARFSPTAWPSIAQPIRDRLRERQRDALVDLLVHRSPEVKDRDDLFGALLMDVDLSCCNRTTRLLFATGAVQLFLQRSFMNLEVENDVEMSDLDAEEWSWMKRYRVWEANRKIFLYPENWVQPELRTDKTPLFKQLEEELGQSEPDEGVVERAYINYLERLHEIARLEVCGMYHELEHDTISVTDRMHVFGRTKGDPAKVFYRRREDDAYWTAWEELPFTVDSDHILPLIANRRLMLIWVKIGIQAQQPDPPQEGNAKVPRYRQLSLSWAERKDGQWTAPRTSESKLNIPSSFEDASLPDGPSPNRDIFVTSQVKGGAIEIRVNTGLYDLMVTGWGRFVYNPCSDSFEGDQTGYGTRWIGNNNLTTGFPEPYNTRQSHQKYLGRKLAGSQLRVPRPGQMNQGLVYSPKILGIPHEFSVMFPRQEHSLNGERPFVFSDRYVAFYIRYGQEQQDPSDSAANSQAVQTPASMSLVPYFSFTESKVVATELPSNAALGLMLSGGDNAATTQQWLPDLAPAPIKYRVELFYHPYTCLFLQQVRRFGVPGLLDPNVATLSDNDQLLFQQITEALDNDYFDGVTSIHQRPKKEIDFRFGGAYSVYNWELFFHIPMYIADRLMAERRFAEAQRWLGYVFNPLRRPTELDNNSGAHYWRIKPFRQVAADMSIQALMELLHDPGTDPDLADKKSDLLNEIEQWRKNPFHPHDVARLRRTAYMRAVVMKYLDNLIAWGDDLFRQDTRESTQESVQLYILALQLLGKRPREVDGDEHGDKTYEEAKGDLDAFSNFLVEIENDVVGYGAKDLGIKVNHKAQANVQHAQPATLNLAYVIPPDEDQILVAAPKAPVRKPRPPFTVSFVANGPEQLYFCIPPNDKLLRYWDIVADRLFKLRNCLNLDGIRRDLALFDPPIDPALLAKAAAQGIDIGTAVSNLYAPLPHYRFLPHLGIAKEFASQVASLGGALLQALEKRDAEALAVLRGSHEVALLKVVRQVKEKSLDEARANVEALQKGRLVAEQRLRYYRSRPRMNALEKAELGMTIAGTVVDIIGGAFLAAGGVASALPTINIGVSGWTGTPVVTAAWGGENLGRGLGKAGQALNVIAGALHRTAGILGTQASYTRRKEDWDFQADLAELEIGQIDKQITAAQIRVAMGGLELSNHDQQAEQSSEALEFMQSKFTNIELYSWMAAELSKSFHLAYQLAIDLARRAERCYRYELAVEDTEDFIQFGHWDNRRQGILAGERLAHDLRRMEAAYYQDNRREYELTKRVSLASLDPVALLALRKTGACHFNLPGVIFNLDHASHYLRRIKAVGVSIPAVTGPYTNVGVTLTYETGSLRKKADDEPVGIGGPSQSVAISVGQEDGGLFEMNLRDERYLPFEGRPLEDSKWRLELPGELRQFDYDTISDVVFTVRYTAREGGSTTAGIVKPGLKLALDGLEREDGTLHGKGQVQLFSARAEFPEAWRSFVAEGADNGDATLTLDLGVDRLPHPHLPPDGRTIEYVALFVRWPNDEAIALPDTVFALATLTAPGAVAVPIGPAFAKYKQDVAPDYNYVYYASSAAELGHAPGSWTFNVPGGWPSGLDPADMLIVVVHKST